MNSFVILRSDQIRQTIDTEQVFESWRSVSNELRHRFSGSMAWKTVAGKDYLYRKTGTIWKSLGPRSSETELTFVQFHEGRQERRERLSVLAARLDEMAAVNRAMRLGRMPLMTARIIRALNRANLLGTAFDIVGTNALFAYERLCGVRIESGLLATGDIDLLFDARTNLNLLRRNISAEGLMGILRATDGSFKPLAKKSFRAANKDGYLVDLIGPAPPNPLVNSKPVSLSDSEDDLAAVEIEGLQWLINSPKVTAVVLDERGYPVEYTCPDARSFALHKLWLSRREDRDPLKKSRDETQAKAVAEMVQLYLPHLRFDDAALGAIPKSLRNLAKELQGPARHPPDDTTEPNW
ncbi:GSU2403 family nucleotidyltransferase fold protein [Rhizobium binxianense]